MMHAELLQKFLDRELNSDELQTFNLLYDKDEKFKIQVDLYKDIILGIRHAEVAKLRSTVQDIHEEILPEINDILAFESDLSKSLRFKQKEDIKSEVLKVKADFMKETNRTEEKSIAPRKLFRMIALAASLLLIISLSIYLFSNKDNVDTEGMAKAYSIIKLGSQSAGIADPNQSNYLHQQRVFELLDNNKMDSARLIQDTYYSSQAKTADYYVINGLIYFKSGKNALAKKSFNDGISHGDQCLSQLLLALMNDKGITETNKIASEIKENVACQSSELVTSILKELKW
ncbi:MAG: hypothetical protein ABIR66_10220 [Saprospiraceae bacterium]